jgi:tyrosine-protein kinase Etk/Wzc
LDIFQLDVPPDLLDEKLRLVAGEHGAYTLQDDDGNVLVNGVAGQLATGHGVTMQVRTLRANPGTHFDVVQHSHLATITQLQKDIEASEQGKDSGIIQLTYNNTDPVLATQLLNQVTALYVRQNVDRSAAEAASSLKFVARAIAQGERGVGAGDTGIEYLPTARAFSRYQHADPVLARSKRGIGH